MTLNAVTLRAADGHTLFDNLSLELGRQRAALVGRNGTGKTSLFRLIAGEARPDRGDVLRHGTIGLLHQTYRPRVDETLADTMGVSADLERLGRILAGQGTADDLTQADWTLEERIREALAQVGLDGLDPARCSQSLSGGELTRLRLAGLLIAAPGLILLDEPTNHLDAESRSIVYRLVETWKGGLAVISHDRGLLRRMDRIIEISGLGLRSYGGRWDDYVAVREIERLAADRALSHAERQAQQTQRMAQQALERQARRDRAGRKERAGSSDPLMMLDARAERAEHSAGRQARLAQRQREEAEARLAQARSAVERDTALPMALSSVDLHAGRTVLEMAQVVWSSADGQTRLGPLDLRLVGPERLAITGPNGAGKSCLLKLMAGRLTPTQGRVMRGVGIAYLDQSLSLLDPAQDLIDNWLAHNPQAGRHEAHAALARFGFRNRAAQKRAGEVSGGERLRAGLACVMAGTAPVSLLLLDEPTNHLDLEAIEALEQVLARYRGALVVVSHDADFLARIGIEREVRLKSGQAVEGDGAAIAGGCAA